MELAEGSYSTDVMSGEDDARKVLHLESISSNFNLLTADEGRIPEKKRFFWTSHLQRIGGIKSGIPYLSVRMGDSSFEKTNLYSCGNRKQPSLYFI